MCPPIPQFYPKEQQQELLEEGSQRRTSAWQYFPKYSTREAVPPGPAQPEMLSWYSPGWVSPDHSLPLFHPVNGKFTPAP